MVRMVEFNAMAEDAETCDNGIVGEFGKILCL